jgi:uncharacterized membrane protein YjjB (DUF3815 family)
MTDHLITILAASLGSTGFAFLFNTKKIQILCAAVSGLMVSGMYILLSTGYDSILLNNMLCAMFVTAYAEIFARIMKAPSSVFLLPAFIPLVPGGYLYYAMYGLVTGSPDEAWQNANATMMTGLGIAMGILVVSVIVTSVEMFRKNQNEDETEMGDK